MLLLKLIKCPERIYDSVSDMQLYLMDIWRGDGGSISRQRDVIPKKGTITWNKYAYTTHALPSRTTLCRNNKKLLAVKYFLFSFIFLQSIVGYIQLPQSRPRCQLESIEVITLFRGGREGRGGCRGVGKHRRRGERELVGEEG